MFLGDCEKLQRFLPGEASGFDVQREHNRGLLVSLSGSCSLSGERAAISEGLKQTRSAELCILLFLLFSSLSGPKSSSLAPEQEHSGLLPPVSIWP